jgi:4-amino-4-deoxy-L-arabinose transferase-like glycosyltransferase
MEAAAVTFRRLPVVALSARRAAICGVGLITLGGAALRLGFSFKSITPNPFYDAAVRSMSTSWHNFFFGSFEPGGSVSVDKTPADLWIQVASVKLFGYSSASLRLPEALAGTAAVPLLYALVARLFGRAAGFASAAALAVLPVAVVTARSDTMDSLMMALLVLAALLAVRAAQSNRAPLAAGAVIGLAFNVKLFQALVPAPAIAVMFLLVANGAVRHRVLQLLKGALALVVVALSWITVAAQFPLGSRPYPIGSTNGGIWNVVFDFNGVSRLRTPPTPAAAALDPAGLGRLFHAHGIFYGSLIGTELLAALVLGGLALLVTAVVARRTPRDAQDRDARRLRRAGAVGFGLWLIAGTLLFSKMGRLHPRYLEALSPAVAASLGIGVATLGALAARHRAAAIALAAGTGIAVLAALGFARAAAFPHAAALVGVFVVAACAVVVVLHRRTRPSWTAPVLTVLALATVLAMPLGMATHLAARGATESGRPGYMAPSRVAALSRYLAAHNHGARYEFASSSAVKAGPVIAHDGKPVLVLTSLYERQLTTVPTLARAVRSGQVRYALLGPMHCAACIPSVRWARAHATDVGRRAGVGRGLLYRLSTRVVHHQGSTRAVHHR